MEKYERIKEKLKLNHSYWMGMVMKPNKVLCCMFLFAFMALTMHKTQLLFTPY